MLGVSLVDSSSGDSYAVSISYEKSSIFELRDKAKCAAAKLFDVGYDWSVLEESKQKALFDFAKKIDSNCYCRFNVRVLKSVLIGK